jgi:hypothetical protein
MGAAASAFALTPAPASSRRLAIWMSPPIAAKYRADGKLKAPRIHKFPLVKAGEAFKLLGQTDGKIVVTI